MVTYAQLIKDLGYKFRDGSWLELALTHRSIGSTNNERLEFLGDAILNFIIADELYARFSQASEGQLTRMRASLICEDMLTDIARACNIGKYIILGAGEQRSGGHQRASILADALEAIIGAIYLDCNKDIQQVKIVVLAWYSDKFQVFNDKKVQNYKDPKTVLQELMQAKKLNLPEYEITIVEGERHDQTFHVLCKVDILTNPVSGVGGSRRKAEQMAAAKVLELINAHK